MGWRARLAARAVMGRWLAGIGLAAAALAAHGRGADGRLDVLLQPHEGAPAVVEPGGEFRFRARKDARVALRRADETVALESRILRRGGGPFRGVARVPESAAPGWYGLTMADSNGLLDSTRHCVLVTEYPESMTVGHIAEPRIGDGGAEERFSAALAFTETQGAQTIVVTGELTAGGKDAEYRRLLSALRQTAAPVFLSPGPSDGRGGDSAEYLGPLPYGVLMGPVGVLGFSTAAPIASPGSAGEAGDLYVLRRELMPARWAVGATYRYSGLMPMRAQLTLFLDWPLHVLLVSRQADRPEGLERANPWGTTTILETPPLASGEVRLLEVGPEAGQASRLVRVPVAAGPNDPAE